MKKRQPNRSSVFNSLRYCRKNTSVEIGNEKLRSQFAFKLSVKLRVGHKRRYEYLLCFCCPKSLCALCVDLIYLIALIYNRITHFAIKFVFCFLARFARSILTCAATASLFTENSSESLEIYISSSTGLLSDAKTAAADFK